MRRLMPFFLSSLALLLLVPSLRAQTADVSGAWEVTWETFRGTATMDVTFAQDGSALSGSGKISLPGGPRGRSPQPREVEVAEGSVDGDRITFSFEFEPMGRRQTGRDLVMTFTGTVSGNEMEGTVSGMRGNENPFTGVKKQ